MPARIIDIRHLKTLARLRRVNRQLALWDELDAMSLMPPSLRPCVPVPLLRRETLEELRAELVAALGEFRRSVALVRASSRSGGL